MLLRMVGSLAHAFTRYIVYAMFLCGLAQVWVHRAAPPLRCGFTFHFTPFFVSMMNDQVHWFINVQMIQQCVQYICYVEQSCQPLANLCFLPTDAFIRYFIRSAHRPMLPNITLHCRLCYMNTHFFSPYKHVTRSSSMRIFNLSPCAFGPSLHFGHDFNSLFTKLSHTSCWWLCQGLQVLTSSST